MLWKLLAKLVMGGAIEKIESLTPDLIFLDIQMPIYRVRSH